MNTPYHSPQTHEILAYAREHYHAEPEFLWASPQNSQNSILRNPKTKKWFAAILVVKESKILPTGDSDKSIEILDLRFQPHEAPDFAASTPGIYPGYHMNKNNWITIILDGSLPTATITSLLAQSYALAK